jgi:hypothetical protein
LNVESDARREQNEKQSRALARVLQKEWGGRVRLECTGGEWPTQFAILRIPRLGEGWIEVAPDSWQVNFDFRWVAPGLERELPGWFMVNRTKPVDFVLWKDSKPVRMPGVFAHYDAPVARGPTTPARAVTRFARAHEATIRALALRPGEFVFFGSGRLALRCVGDDMALARRRFAILRPLLGDESPAPAPEPMLFAREFRFKPATRGARHRLGGAHAAPPACPECGGAAQLVTELDLRDPKLPKTKLRRKTWPVFWCLECCAWGPTFHDISAERLVALDAKGRPVRPPEAVAPTRLRERRMTLQASPKGKTESSGSKAGGTACWLQSPDVPACPNCLGAMRFVLQLASDRTISYADVGQLYSFACPNCRVSATLVQSH